MNPGFASPTWASVPSVREAAAVAGDLAEPCGNFARFMAQATVAPAPEGKTRTVDELDGDSSNPSEADKGAPSKKRLRRPDEALAIGSWVTAIEFAAPIAGLLAPEQPGATGQSTAGKYDAVSNQASPSPSDSNSDGPPAATLSPQARASALATLLPGGEVHSLQPTQAASSENNPLLNIQSSAGSSAGTMGVAPTTKAVSDSAAHGTATNLSEKPLIPFESQAGMSAALTLDEMQTRPQMNENSGLAEQNLPSLATLLACSELPERDRKPTVSAVQRKVSAVPASEASRLTIIAQPSQEDVRAQSLIDAPRPTSLELVARSIEQAVIQLRQVDAASLSVLLKPDSNTQLMLHLKCHQGQFEAVAVLERGDLAALNSEWLQLQHRLAEQGIRLASLASSHQDTRFASNQFSSTRDERQLLLKVEQPQSPVGGKSAGGRSGIRAKRAAYEREWWA